MGVVYLAEHLHLGRKVALKFLAPDLAAESADYRERFIRESRLAASIPHPHIVTVYDAGEYDGQLYIAMQYVEGTDLATLLHEHGALEPEHAVSVLEQVADALDAAHAAGLVHRDVKPANVLIKDRQCYLTDFGLTKRAAGSRALTQTGQFVGTLEYMAPEQIEGRPVDGRCDEYALGCLLFHVLSGNVPFGRDSAVATIWAHLSEPPPRLSDATDVPSAMDAVIERALAKDPDDRFQSCGELAESARAALGGTRPAKPTTRRRSRPRTVPPTSRPSLPPRRRRAPLALAGAALAAAAVVAVALVALLGGDDGAQRDGDRGAPSAGPLRVRSIPLEGISFGVAADPEHSSVWVSSPDRNVLSRIDTGANAVVERPLPVGEDPFFLALGDGYVWVPSAETGTVTRIPARRRIANVRRIRVGGTPRAVAVSAGTVWIADATGFLRRLDTGTLRLRGKPTRIGRGAWGVAADPTGAFVSSSADGTVTAIDIDGRVVGKPIKVGAQPGGMTIADGVVWVSVTRDARVVRIDSGTRRIVGKPIPVGRGPTGLAAGAGYIWVANSGDGTVWRLDPSTGRRVGPPIKVGAGPLAVSVGDKAVWVSTVQDEVVKVIELPESGS